MSLAADHLQERWGTPRSKTVGWHDPATLGALADARGPGGELVGHATSSLAVLRP